MRGGERGHCIGRDHAYWIHLHTDPVTQGIEAGHQTDAGGSACGGRVGLCEFHAHGGKRLHIGSDVEMIQIISHRVSSSVVIERNRSVGDPHVIHEKDDDVGAVLVRSQGPFYYRSSTLSAIYGNPPLPQFVLQHFRIGASRDAVSHAHNARRFRRRCGRRV